MSRARLLPAVVLAIAVCAFPTAAAAEEIVPPGNSAAAQYTEAFPTAGGEKEAGSEGKKKPVPGEVIGARNSHKLESKGAEGKAVAEFAAETSPAAPTASTAQGPESAPAAGAGDGGEPQAKKEAKGSDGGDGGGGDEKNSAGATAGGQGGPGAGDGAPQVSGSSGFGEVVGQATGSYSSGELGLLLPLIVIGAVVWSLVYFWRQRRGQRVA